MDEENTCSDEEPFNCTKGDNKFCEQASFIEDERDKRVDQVDTNGLSQHEKEHISDKPFSCSSCDKKFKDKAALNNHEIKSHF